MAILDDKYVMADSNTLASISSGSTSIIGSVIDLGSLTDGWDNSKTPDIGEGGADLEFRCNCEDEAFASLGSPAITIALVTANDASLSSSASTLITKSSIAKGSGTDGANLVRDKIPPGTIKRYVGTKVTVATAVLTAGKITSFIAKHVDSTIAQKK